MQIRLAAGPRPDDIAYPSHLLDATPGPSVPGFDGAGHVDAGLLVGQTFEDPYAGISITLDKVEAHPDDPDGPPMYATVTVKRS